MVNMYVESMNSDDDDDDDDGYIFLEPYWTPNVPAAWRRLG